MMRCASSFTFLGLHCAVMIVGVIAAAAAAAVL